MRPRNRILLVLSLVAAVTVPVAGPAMAGADHHGPPPPGASNAVLAWNETATTAAAACGLTGKPPIEARLYAMMHIAVHDALNAIKLRSRPYAFSPDTLRPNASPEAAVAEAAYTVLEKGLTEAGCLPSTPVDNAYTAALQAIPDGDAKASGRELGAMSAAEIREVRRVDNAADQITNFVDPKFPQGSKPGQWKFTPAADGVKINEFAFLPKWGTVTPFTLRDSGQFAPTSGPYPLNSRAYARDLNEVKRLGGNGAGNTKPQRTDDQTQIALFWVGSSPYQWNSIARTVAADSRRLDLWDDARLFGLLNMAMADGYIGSFAVKFSVLFWRPVTAIREADTDGNSLTVADPTWTPLAETPPIPDYDSGHAVQGGAAATVLAGFFGTDRVRFSVCSPTLPEAEENCGGSAEVRRQFSAFSQASAENGVSRIYVGYHFRKAVNDGIKHGQLIGGHAVWTAMRPVHG